MCAGPNGSWRRRRRASGWPRLTSSRDSHCSAPLICRAATSAACLAPAAVPGGFGPRVLWPVFDAGRIRANIGVQTARQETTLARYEQAVLVALEDVENALVAFAQERLRHRALAEAVVANRRAVDLSMEVYTRGVGDFLSVLESQRSLFGSEDQLVQSERAVVANLITVYKALGGGWEGWPPIERAAPRAAAAAGS